MSEFDSVRGDIAALAEQGEYATRLEFLYKVVEDTQNTIRFLDTKAAFCVTLISGMVAGVLERKRGEMHGVAFVLFVVVVAISLVACLRVIFPLVKPHKAKPVHPDRKLPKFFLHHRASHHWLRHTFSNSVGDVLCEDHESYTETMRAAKDEDLLASMCDEVLLISLIRQIKSDRMQTAMYGLMAAVVLFAVVMLG